MGGVAARAAARPSPTRKDDSAHTQPLPRPDLVGGRCLDDGARRNGAARAQHPRASEVRIVRPQADGQDV